MSFFEYIIFVGMNILKTLQRLAATAERFFREIFLGETFFKYRKMLADNNTSQRKP